MPVKQFNGRIGPLWMGRLEMLLSFCSKPNHPITDVVEKLHGDIYVLGATRVRHAALFPSPMAPGT